VILKIDLAGKPAGNGRPQGTDGRREIGGPPCCAKWAAGEGFAVPVLKRWIDKIGF
jgi:hypothetical protein